MANGTINLSKSKTSGSYIEGKIVWSATADSDSNSSKNVTAKIYVRKDNTDMELTITTQGTWEYSLTVNGSKVSGSVSKSVLTDWVLIGTKTVSSIAHGDDGTKYITISGSVTAPTGTSFEGHTTSGSGKAVFDTIPRASTITAVSDVTLGNKCSVKWTPASASFRYKLKFSIGDWSYTTGAIHPNKTSAYTYTGYTIPLAAASQLPSAKTGTMKVTLYTYSNSAATAQVGSASSDTFTVTVPNSSATQPAVTLALSAVSSLADAFDGLYIQGKTKVKATLSADGKYDAEIKSYSMKVEGKSYDSGDSYTSGYLSNYGSIKVYGYAKDSRGFTGSTSKTITVIAYSKPKILAASGEKDVVAARCDSNGTLSDSGTYLKIKAKRSYSLVKSGGVQKNFCKIRFRYKAASASSYSAWTTILAGSSLGSDEITTGALLGGVLAADTSYMVQVGVIDDIGESAYTTIAVPTDKVYCHRDGARNSFSFGGYVEDDNTFAIAPGIDFKVKSLTGETVVVSDTGWISLGLSDSVVERENVAGRIGKGCYYRVINGNHVYVAFCCQFTFANNAAVTINGAKIPEKYRPSCNMYQHCIACDRLIARCKVVPDGDIVVDWVQNMAANAITTAYEVSWIDGYIDYWLKGK